MRVNGNIEGEQVRGALLGRAQGAEVEMWVIRFMAAGVAHAKFFFFFFYFLLCFFFFCLFCFSIFLQSEIILNVQTGRRATEDTV